MSKQPMELWKILITPIILGILLILSGYLYWNLHGANNTLKKNLGTLQANLDAKEIDLASTTYALHTEQNNFQMLKEKVDEMSGKVGTLVKLSKTDPELLKKYSKIYFLNENYIPTKLTDIDPQYALNPGKILQIHADIWPHLEKLLQDAEDDGIDLKVISAYRSFGTQAALKTSYKVTYGSGANAFSSDQGYSEHQLGTTIDFTTKTVGSTFVGFEKTDAYAWLQKRAYRYGFILSYPQGNTYYQYEPWHWRYVGTDLARYIHRENLNFYDMNQRDIDEYLVDFFD